MRVFRQCGGGALDLMQALQKRTTILRQKTCDNEKLRQQRERALASARSEQDTL